MIALWAPWWFALALDGHGPHTTARQAHLSIEKGSALIVVGSLVSAESDGRCRRKLGFSFDDLKARVAPLVLHH